MTRRLNGLAGLFLTAFFAGVGAFHHHELPKSAHQHAGFCSQASVPISIESCALCKASHTSARVPARAAVPDELAFTRARVATAPPVRSNIEASLLSDPRAPPAV